MTTQRNQQWLNTATPDEINAAFDNGELAELLGRTPDADQQ